MKAIFTILATATAFLTLTGSVSAADNLERLAGKWSVQKTNSDGEKYTQTIEIRKDGFTFQVIGVDQGVRIHAEGMVKEEKLGPFHTLRFHDIRAGSSATDLQPLEEERTVVYQLGYNTLTLATNFDAEREEGPALDVYRKAAR